MKELRSWADGVLRGWEVAELGLGRCGATVFLNQRVVFQRLVLLVSGRSKIAENATTKKMRLCTWSGNVHTFNLKVFFWSTFRLHN